MRNIKTITPKFYFWYNFIKIPPFLIVPCTLVVVTLIYWLQETFFLPMLYIFLHTMGNIFDIYNQGISPMCKRILLVTGVLIYPVILWSLFLLCKKIFYKRVNFIFNDQGITYTINFFIYSQKQVKYSDIKEITLDQGVLQRLFGLATIKVKTHANTPKSGIEIYNIKPYQDTYDFLISKVNP